jgi:hypothetical protein
MIAGMQFKRNLKKIHLLGKGPTWINCPGREEKYEVKGEEIWGAGSVFNNNVSVDRIFLMHDPRQELIYEDRGYFKHVREYDKPVYSHEKYDVLGPKNAEYPVDYVLSHFPRVYYTNAVCWMLALAILMEPEEIIYHGIDMQVAVEYHNERGGTEYWTGQADGRGIKVTIPDGSAICTTNSLWGPLYGAIPIVSNGFMTDWITDFRGFDRPKILEQYRLVPIADAYQGPIKDWDKVCTCVSGT